MKTTDFDGFLKRDLAHASLVLVHGADTGLVSERCKTIIAAALDNPDDPFQLVRLDGDEIASDPARLADEALTIGLFGGRRVIWVRAGSKAIVNAVQPLADDPPKDCLILIEAGELKKTAPLRTLCERSRHVATIICYGDESKSLTALAGEIIRNAGLSIGERALQRLVAALGGDRIASRGEIEKLVLYCHGNGTIEEGDVETIVADVATLESHFLVDAVYDGSLIGIESRVTRLLGEGMDPSSVLGHVLRHAFALKRLESSGATGREGLAALATQQGIYFKRHDSVVGQLRHWRGDRIDRAIAQLSEAVRQTRRTPQLGEAIAIRALWGLALTARRAPSRQR